jgi:hypothetical protein
MNTKTLGIVIIIGAIMVFYTGFNYVTTKKVIEIGPIEINQQQSHPVKWSPIVGVILIIRVFIARDKEIRPELKIFINQNFNNQSSKMKK